MFRKLTTQDSAQAQKLSADSSASHACADNNDRIDRINEAEYLISGSIAAMPDTDPLLAAEQQCRKHEDIINALMIEQEEIAEIYKERILDAMDRYASETDGPEHGIIDQRRAEIRLLRSINSIIRQRESELARLINKGKSRLSFDNLYDNMPSAKKAADPDSPYQGTDPENVGF